MSRKNKLVGWLSSTVVDEPKQVTRFEKEVQKLSLVVDNKEVELAKWIDNHLSLWTKSEPLKKWVEKNKKDFYVPERLLRAYGFFPIIDDNPNCVEYKTLITESIPGVTPATPIGTIAPKNDAETLWIGE